MAFVQLSNVRLYVERTGSGEPLVLVHGSWGDARDWSRVSGPLSEDFTVIRYDRRGHSRSEQITTQGSPQEDADDLAALVRSMDFATVHVAANSWGGIVALHCVIRHPGLITKLALHEPPLFDLIKDDPVCKDVYDAASRQVREAAMRIEAGDDEDGAKTFVETAVEGPGGWDTFPASAKRTFVRNASTFLDEMRDTNALYLGMEQLRSVTIPVLLTRGTISPPIYAPILDVLRVSLPTARMEVIQGAGHVPQISHADEFCALLTDFLHSSASRP